MTEESRSAIVAWYWEVTRHPEWRIVVDDSTGCIIF